MERRLVIEPVTRIEGHARITIHRDHQGLVQEARLQVLELRGFEQFCIGRPFTEMPAITARICGICPVSHQLAAADAGDQLLAVGCPPAAQRLRVLLSLAQITQSHALSFFHLSCPDLLLGWDTEPARRNLFGLIAAEPDLARAGIRLRQFGQRAIEAVTGQTIHGAWAVPGGGLTPLSAEGLESIRAGLPEARAAVQLALDRYKQRLDGPLQRDQAEFGQFPSLHLAQVDAAGNWCVLGGRLRLIDGEGVIQADQLEAAQYNQWLGEAMEPWSSLPFPYVRALGYPAGIYRVGPLARLNVCEQIDTPWAARELTDYRQRNGRIVNSSFAYHQARLVEIVACLEALERLLDDPLLLDPEVRYRASVNTLDAVGMGEAPRGTLFHHYRIDRNGLLEHVNLLVATGQNNLAMNRTITGLAKRFLDGRGGEPIPEALFNRIEAGIRCFDPCLSCATHAAGQMALQLQLFDHDGTLLAERTRP